MSAFEEAMAILSSHELEDLLIDSKCDMEPFFVSSLEELDALDMEKEFDSSLEEAMDDFGIPADIRLTLKNNIGFLLFSLLRTEGQLDLGRMVNDLPGFVLFSAVYAFLEDNATDDDENPQKFIRWYYLLRTMHLFLYKEESDEDAGLNILSNSSVIMRMLSKSGEWRRIREVGNDSLAFAEDFVKKYPESDEYRHLMAIIHYTLAWAVKEGFNDDASFRSHMRDTASLIDTLPDDMAEVMEAMKEDALKQLIR